MKIVKTSPANEIKNEINNLIKITNTIKDHKLKTDIYNIAISLSVSLENLIDEINTKNV